MFNDAKKNIKFKMLCELVYLLIYKRRHCNDKNNLKITSSTKSINYYNCDNYYNFAQFI